ncbi:hypothetical protein [[Eubacterium] cellulosolvens]
MKKNDGDNLNINTELLLEYVMKRFKFGGYVLQPRSFKNINNNHETLEKTSFKVSWHHLFVINFISEEQSKLKTRDNFPRVIRHRPIG